MEKGKPGASTTSYSTQGFNSGSNNQDAENFVLLQIALSKGGGAIRGIEEKFEVNSITGACSFSLPMPFSPSRDGVPAVGLGYNSGRGNSPFGLGWQLGVSSIVQKTEKRLPEYHDEEESDAFIVAGAEDLVPLLENQAGTWVRHSQQRSINGISYTIRSYRLRIEGSFVRSEKWQNRRTGEIHWKAISTTNVHSYYGLTSASRIADPDDPSKIFECFLCRTHGDKANITLFEYKPEDFESIPDLIFAKNRVGNCVRLYLKNVSYGVERPYYLNDPVRGENDFMFQFVSDYGEHDSSSSVSRSISDASTNIWNCRNNRFSSYRSGFEIRTYRRCKGVLSFNCFDELPVNLCIVRSLDLFYNDKLDSNGLGKKETGSSYLIQARQNGYKWQPGANACSVKSLPEIEAAYQEHEWNTEIKTVSHDNVLNVPTGLHDKRLLWGDLQNEGISGILTEPSKGLHYISNLGSGEFSMAQHVSTKPSFSGPGEGRMVLQELRGDVTKYLVSLVEQPKGFFKFDDSAQLEPFKSFAAVPISIRPLLVNVQLFLNEGVMFSRHACLLVDHGECSGFRDQHASRSQKGFKILFPSSRKARRKIMVLRTCISIHGIQ